MENSSIKRAQPLRRIKGIDAGNLVVVLGERGCGKSTLINTLTGLVSPSGKHQSNQTHPTIGCEFHRLTTPSASLYLWDTPTAGSHRLADTIRLHLHETDLVLLVYSLADFSSYLELKFWIRLLEGCTAKLFLLANKIDDRISYQRRDQQLAAGRSLAQKKNYKFLEVSGLTGQNLQQLLQMMLAETQPVAQQASVQKESFSIGLLDHEQKKGCHCKCSLM